MTIGENILKLRKSNGMSQETLAEKMFVTRQTVSLWETDQTLPTIENLIRLKEIFGVSIDSFVCTDGTKEPKLNVPLTYSCVSNTDEAQLGINPINAASAGWKVCVDNKKLCKRSSPTNSLKAVKIN